jgi:hypothetical protein
MGGSSFVRSTESISESILMPLIMGVGLASTSQGPHEEPYIGNFETLCFVALAIHFENTAIALIVRGFLDVRNAKPSSGFKVVGWKVGMWWVEMVCGKDFGVGESPFSGSWSGHTVPSWPSSDYSRMRGNIKSSLSRWLEIVIACEGGCGK